MKGPEREEKASLEEASPSTECRAEFIFYARNQVRELRSVGALGDCACDFRRPDWVLRWADWNSGLNPYLNLFLCANHAREFGLM